METTNILELAKNKLLILYIIEQGKSLFDEEKLTSFILKNELLNFFLFKQYTAELIENNFIKINQDKLFYISQDAKATLEIFDDKLDIATKEKILDLLNDCQKNEVPSTIAFADYIIDDKGRFFVSLIIEENNTGIFNLTLEVPNEKYAKNICEKFKESPDLLYLNVIKYLDQ